MSDQYTWIQALAVTLGLVDGILLILWSKEHIARARDNKKHLVEFDKLVDEQAKLIGDQISANYKDGYFAGVASTEKESVRLQTKLADDYKTYQYRLAAEKRNHEAVLAEVKEGYRRSLDKEIHQHDESLIIEYQQQLVDAGAEHERKMQLLRDQLKVANESRDFYADQHKQIAEREKLLDTERISAVSAKVSAESQRDNLSEKHTYATRQIELGIQCIDKLRNDIAILRAKNAQLQELQDRLAKITDELRNMIDRASRGVAFDLNEPEPSD